MSTPEVTALDLPGKVLDFAKRAYTAGWNARDLYSRPVSKATLKKHNVTEEQRLGEINWDKFLQEFE